MPYIESTIIAGKVKEITKYHTFRYKSPKRPRSKNQNTTTEQQKKINERSAFKKLYLAINANFQEDDLYLTCTYNKESKEPTPDEAKLFFSKYIRKLRCLYKKAGAVLKYIGITEHQKRRMHHHILINNIGLGINQIKKLWNFGFMKVQIFAGEPEDCERLASYFIKESNNTFNTEEKVHGLRWISSKNLIHPVPQLKVVHAGSWLEEPKPAKGYYIVYVKRGVTENNYPYQFYRMIKIPDSDEDNNF